MSLNPFSTEIEVTSKIHVDDFLPEQVTRNVGNQLAASAEARIISRTMEGKFPGNPQGTGGLQRKRYSRAPAFIPATRIGDRTSRKRRYEKKAQRARGMAQQGAGGLDFLRSRAGNPWLYVPGGYAQFRSLAGLQSSFVSLSFTGKMLEDMTVRPVFKDVEDVFKAALTLTGGKVGSSIAASKSSFVQQQVEGEIGTISLQIGFETQSSWQIAKWQGERYSNYFALLTPEEQREIREEARNLLSRARATFGTENPSFAPRDPETGQFIPIDY